MAMAIAIRSTWLPLTRAPPGSSVEAMRRVRGLQLKRLVGHTAVLDTRGTVRRIPLRVPHLGGVAARCPAACSAPARQWASSSAGEHDQGASAEALAQQYCELQGVALDDDMRDRLALTMAAATAEDSRASYEEWLKELDDESAGVVRQLVKAHEAGDVIRPPERPKGWRQGLRSGISLAAQLKEQAQRELAAKAKQRGWTPRDKREGGRVNDDGSALNAEGSAAGLQPAQDKPQGPRKGFEELLPEDWRGGDEGEQPPSPAAGPLAPVGTAVAEHSWKPEEEGDLALTEGETIEVLSTTEPGSGWWTGRRQCSDGSVEEGAFPANYVLLLETPRDATGDDAGPADADADASPEPESVPLLLQEDDALRVSESTRIPAAARELLDDAAASLSRLRGILDSRVVGQSDVKEGILLALMTREHIYIEGPPGVAKTFTAEITAEATALSAYV
jgi:hypothetical protein